MSTSPTNQGALLWNAPKPPARGPRPGERLWTLRKDGRIMHAELRDGELTYDRRHTARGIALDEAAGCRAQFEADGWTADGA